MCCEFLYRYKTIIKNSRKGNKNVSENNDFEDIIFSNYCGDIEIIFY